MLTLRLQPRVHLLLVPTHVYYMCSHCVHVIDMCVCLSVSMLNISLTHTLSRNMITTTSVASVRPDEDERKQRIANLRRMRKQAVETNPDGKMNGRRAEGSDDEDDEATKDDKQSLKALRKKRKQQRESDDRLPRTVFVGNVSNKLSQREIRDHFSDCGPIASTRIRSVAFADPKVPRKGSFVSKAFHEKRSTFNVYVVFKEEASVPVALEKNNSEFGGTVIRVDRADNSAQKKKEMNHSASVFVGNLAFEIEEDALRGESSGGQFMHCCCVYQCVCVCVCVSV
jgi:RNA recognition motif-containing protein